jgi:hypothetical protein
MKTHFTFCIFLSVALLFTTVSTIKGQHLEKFENGKFIVKPGDTVALPLYPEIGKTYRFKGERKGLAMKLKLKKLNDSAINYQLNIVFPDHKKLNEKGTVYLNKGFYLGSEEREQLSNGIMISCDNYFPKDEYMEICIGQLKDGNLPPDKDPLFVQIQRWVADEPEIDLDNTPELIQLK